MRRLLSLSVLAAIALGALSGSAMAARVSISPSGAVRATARSFVIEVMGSFSVNCEMVLSGELNSRAAEGTLGVLGSIVIGRWTRATVANCAGGTMRVELLTAASISVNEVTNRTRAELWVLSMRILIEDGRNYRCLYDLLMVVRSRENPFTRLEFIAPTVLEVRTLAGSMACSSTVRASGTFLLGAAVELILS
ncbi:MAG: hypothetical protein WBC33_02700 [Conexibacter sp.]